jgi:hypothetical protein
LKDIRAYRKALIIIREVGAWWWEGRMGGGGERSESEAGSQVITQTPIEGGNGT